MLCCFLVRSFMPGFALGNGLIQLTLMKDLNTIYTNCGKWSFEEAYQKEYHPFSWLVSGHDITFMIVTSFLYFAGAVLIDVILSYPALNAKILPDKDVVDKPIVVRVATADLCLCLPFPHCVGHLVRRGCLLSF